MSNDGRYMYHHNQGLHSPYDYSYHPPQSSYDTNSIQQHPTTQTNRPVRPSSTQSQSSSQQAQYNPSPSSPYPPSYPPGSYMTHAPPQQQWTGDNNWPQYSQSFHPPPVASESSFHSGPGRPDTSLSSSPASPRSYAPASLNASTASPRREPGRQTPAAQLTHHPSPPNQNQNRRPDTDAAVHASALRPGTSPLGLDFRKLLDTYKLIIDTNNNYSNGAGPSPHGRAAPPMDMSSIERMLKAASYGAQMLDAAAHVQHAQPSTTTSPPSRSPKGKEPEPPIPKEPVPAPSSSSNKRQKSDKTEDSTSDSQTCLGCGATSTPEWRRGPMGPRTLCNACGLVYAKLIKKRVKEGAKAGKTNGQGNKSQAGEDLGSSAGGDSDDEDYAPR